MSKVRFGIVLFFIMINSSAVVAQAAAGLFLPEHVDGVIKLNISSILEETAKTFGYEQLAVFVENELKEYSTNNVIQGKHTKEDNNLAFQPYFPFENGLRYIVRTKNANADDYSYHPFIIGEKKTVDKAKVISIYPSASQLPENLLRFYIYFNTPMKEGQALKHIQLVHEQGNIDNHAFMAFKQELWSADGKRLTILFDPGRIKRGVSTNMLRGLALEETKQYSLSIANTWLDVYGQPLSERTRKKIEVTKAYRTKINIDQWLVNKPKGNSKEALTIHFDRIMDHALIQSMIQLKDGAENLVAGHWEILEEEKQIKFIPEKKWNSGKYKIVIDSRLEDVAGNNLKNLLDYNKSEENNNASYQFIYFKI